MKLLTQADDFGFTRATTYGIIDSIDLGILRNTGLFANSRHAEFACSFIKDRPHVSFGIDFNLVSGPSVLKHEEIPHLTDENGIFHKSNYYLSQSLWSSEEGRRQLFPMEEVQKELWAQYKRFIELAGFKPEYLNAHSICPETYLETIFDIGKKEDIPYSDHFFTEHDFKGLPEELGVPDAVVTGKKSFDYEKQVSKDLVSQYLANSDYLLAQKYCLFWNHPGYVDAELFEGTTLSFERFRDAQSMMDERIVRWVKDNDVQLITYKDFK